ncbi:MAG: hypothetical protein AAB875_05870 [Patescibacteria group bacterium]
MDQGVLEKESLLLIFTFAPAGLGHLRVTDALHDGLPVHKPSHLLGSEDRAVEVFHRLTSIHPLARNIFESFQRGIAAKQFTFWYRKYLRSRTKVLKRKLFEIIEKEPGIKEMVVVSTHFGLAHQIAAIKKEIEKEMGVKVYLFVQVTDDSPQEIWYVYGADIIFVPSEKTKEELINYGKAEGYPEVRFEVTPYPISPVFSQSLSQEESEVRLAQTLPDENAPINVSIPVGGAAVSMDYYLALMEELHKLSPRFVFHVVSREKPFTTKFLAEMQNKDYIKVYASKDSREVIKFYEELFKREVFSLEVTKPSEQTFKALLSSQERGGVLLLFSLPVGVQEYDNLNFLERHFLVPGKALNTNLWLMAEEGKKLNEKDDFELLKEACTWRGIRLPKDAGKAAQFVFWCLKERIFSQMVLCTGEPQPNDTSPEELGEGGIRKFWEIVSDYISQDSSK